MGGKHKWWIVFMLLGLAMSVRIAGLFLLPVVVVFYAMKPEKSKWVILISGILIAFFTCYLVFPALWKHPFHGFRDLLFYGASNPWPSGSTLAGFRFEPGQIPGWYTPVWMFFTLPILYLLLFLAGLLVAIIKKQVLRLMPLLLLFFIPMCYMLATGPTLYNAWRHSLYLFFPIMIIAGTAIDAAVSKWKLTAAGVMAVLFPAAFLVSQSKFDYVYFNAFKSAFSPGNFTLDYWGISTRQALHRLNQHQPNGGKIYCFTEIVDLNRNLNPELTNRWKTVKTPDSADFILELNREGRFNSFHGLLLDADLYQNDTVWALYQCRRFR
jgi:hypothetical protein